MATRDQALEYVIYLTDQAQVDAYNAQLDAGAGPGLVKRYYSNGQWKWGVLRAPETGAALEFDAPFQTDLTTFAAPCTRSPWFTAAGANFPTNVATFTRKSGGWFGLPVLFGSTTTFFWLARFAYAPPPAVVIDPETEEPIAAEPTSARRWIDGFELPALGAVAPGEGGTAGAAQDVSRAASRTPDGLGLTLRHSITTRTHLVMDYRGGGTSDQDWSWERFYVRPRVYPAAEIELWAARAMQSNGGVGSEGMRLRMAPTGALIVYSRDNSSVDTLRATGTVLPLNAWSKVDLVLGFTGTSAALNPGRFGSLRVYVNGVQVIDVVAAAIVNQVRTNTNRHYLSVIGTPTANTAELDVDDWMSADCPIVLPDPGDGLRIADYATLERQIDFQAGSHMQLVRPTGFASDHDPLWVGDWRTLLQNPAILPATVPALASSTSGARLSVTTDAERSVLDRPSSLGAAAMVVSIFGSRASVDGQLGYAIGAAADVLATIAQATTVQWNSVLYAPSGVITLAPITPLELIHTKGASAGASAIRSLHAVVELLGAWGPEDAASAPVSVGPHNAPYPLTPWAQGGQTSLSPVVIVGGTWTGNGTGQDVTLRVQPHFLWWRPLTGAITGGHWWSSLLGAHQNLYDTPDAKLLPDVTIDPSFVPGVVENSQETRAVLRLTGNDQQSNANLVVYQYIAVCDPGGRFVRNGAFRHAAAIASAVNALDDALFTPEAAFLLPELLAVGVGTARHWFKGLGHDTTSAQKLDGIVPVSGVADLGLGTLTSRGTNLHDDTASQVGYSAWRSDDGSGDAGVPNVLALFRYEGDGVSPRVITPTPASTRRPLFLLVQPHNAASVYRDPSHTGTTSQNIAGTSIAANGISAGAVGSFTVGSQLNAAGISYEVFLIWGCDTAGENGWSVNCESTPVDTVTLVDPPPDDDLGDDEDDDDAITPPPGLCDDLADTLCSTPTETVVNLALSRIGINNPIVGLACSGTPSGAAEQAVRLHFDLSLEQTLRDLPWPFATRYSTLTLLSGSVASPVNGDWTFKYALPTNCLFARRLVVARGTAVNPTPPPFRLGGGVLYTNEADAQLEYTARVACPALNGDATFRSAWAWRLAAELAPPLTRMADRAVHCVEMYGQTLETARTFLRLGSPGVKPAVDAEDPDTACPSVKLQVINLALIRLGARTIADLTEQSREAVSAALVYEDELRATLRDHAWSFATRYADPLTLVAGTASVPAVPEWFFSYRAPTDMLYARKIVNTLILGGTGRMFDPNPATFRVGSDATGLLIYTNVEDAVLEYTLRLDCALEIGDSMFRDAVAWRLAHALAHAVVVVDPVAEEQTGRAPAVEAKEPRPSEGGKVRLEQLRTERQRHAWQMYLQTLSMAKAANQNESQQPPDGDAAWIRARS